MGSKFKSLLKSVEHQAECRAIVAEMPEVA